MIDTNGFARMIIEKDISIHDLSVLTGVSESDLIKFSKGYKISQKVLEPLCKILNCQPCDLIEFRKTETKGHWEWVEDS